MMSLDPNVDKLYINFTKIVFNYCDGAFQQGGNDVPIQYKDTKLYFRGGKITRSHFKWLINTYNFDKASKIIVTGGSAGGVSSFLWSSYVLSIVKNPNVVYNIPDSGLFLNANMYGTDFPLVQTALQYLMSLAHKS